MGLDKYIKLTDAAKLCGLDKRTLLARLEKKGLVAPLGKHRPMLVREMDVEELMRDWAVQRRVAGVDSEQAQPLGGPGRTGTED